MFDARNWYWFVAGDTANVWSSARAKQVPASDPVYVTWAQSNLTSTIVSMSELYALFTAQFPAGSLQSYNPDARFRRAGGGLTITSISAVPFFSDPVARNTLANANEYAKVTPHDTDWKLQDGSFVVLSPAQLTTATNAMANFVQACFTKEAQNKTAITGGAITTLAQIDAAFATVPNTVA